VEDDKAATLRRKLGDRFGANVRLAAETLGAVDAQEWTAEHLVDVLKTTAESRRIKLGDLMQPIRVVLTGTTVSEPVNELLVAVGREESLRRLRREA
jgi:glutamyl-tRNA synthetase